jgi:hypothetical protein
MPLILNDIDSTSKVAAANSGESFGEARRMNTLQHYGVNDGAVMALVPKQTTLSSTASSYYSNSLNSHAGYSRMPKLAGWFVYDVCSVRDNSSCTLDTALAHDIVRTRQWPHSGVCQTELA